MISIRPSLGRRTSIMIVILGAAFGIGCSFGWGEDRSWGPSVAFGTTEALLVFGWGWCGRVPLSWRLNDYEYEVEHDVRLRTSTVGVAWLGLYVEGAEVMR